MEYSDSFSEEDEEYFPPTTNDESTPDNIFETKYEKWLNSNTDISHISSIYRLENEDSRNKLVNTSKEYRNESKGKKHKKKKIEEDNIEPKDEFSPDENNQENSSDIEEVIQDLNDINKNFIFTWSEGGNDVKITGSFSDWKVQYQMTKDPKDQMFKLELPLKNEIYQYKFIVDNAWKCSKNYPIIDDGYGNINNILDNTKNESVQSKEISTTKKKKKPKRVNTNKTKTRDSSKKKESKKLLNSNSIYQCKYLSDDILPQSLPNKRYYESFKLDNFSNQRSIGTKKYYNFYDNNSISFGASSKSIFILGHINLNHLISAKNSRAKMLKNSMSFRYREKASTFIYYK
jgi:hypothetical protein